MEDRRQKYRTRDMERIKRLRLLDDVFMKVVLDGNIEGVQDIIRVVLKREDIAVLEVRTQKELSNLVGHSVRRAARRRSVRGTTWARWTGTPSPWARITGTWPRRG